MGATAPADPERVVLVADHFAPASDINSATSIKSLRSFARTHGIERFYEPGRGGIEHALLDELGLVGHGTIVFGADSHTCTPGAFNALGMCRTRAVLSARPASSVVEPAVRWPDQLRGGRTHRR